MVIRSIIRAYTERLPIPPPSALAGRTYIVTGSNTGLGYECAKHLVRHAARVILAVRSPTKGQEAKAKIEAETGRTGVAEVWDMDLASYASVKSFAQRACSELERVDGIIENASVAMSNWSVAEGLESSLTVNVISTYLLAVLLLPKLKADAKTFGITPHLVVVGSGAAFMGTQGVLEALKGDIIDQLNSEEHSRAMQTRYPVSKLLQVYATRELASLLPESDTHVVINYLSPGLCSTDLDRNAGFGFKAQLWLLRRLIGRTAEMGSRTLLHAVVAGKASHGQYLNNCEIKDEVPLWVKGETGQSTQKRTWASIAGHLERIQPGCVKQAIQE